VRLADLRHVLITHHHSDHNLDYGNLVYSAWITGLRTQVDCWGPPPIERMTRLYFELNAYDIDTRIADEGRPDPRPMVRVHEFEKPGLVFADEHVKVTAALVDHPPVVPSFAYRFDAADRSIVISGDTTRSDALVALARGADVLVHEVMYVPGIDRLLERLPDAVRLREHLLASHTTTEDVGRVAAAAGVGKLVLTHFVPSDGGVTPETWTEGVRKHFSGEIVVGRDFMEI
jgi:ribonuclease BN (tRNA processing enzyme)